MRIIVISLEDFVNSEVAEHGFDWVEAQFILGYEPILVNGVWLWKDTSSVDIPIGNSITSTNTSTRSSGVGSDTDASRSLSALSTLR